MTQRQFHAGVAVTPSPATRDLEQRKIGGCAEKKGKAVLFSSLSAGSARDGTSNYRKVINDHALTKFPPHSNTNCNEGDRSTRWGAPFTSFSPGLYCSNIFLFLDRFAELWQRARGCRREVKARGQESVGLRVFTLMRGSY